MRCKTLLVVPDTHAPFHSKSAWAAMIKHAKKIKPDGILILGDFVDCFSVSDHDKDPRRSTTLVEECMDAEPLLDELDSLGAKHKWFCMGNHEYRLDRLIMRHAPGLAGAVSINQLLGLSERGWKVSRYGVPVKIGKLYCVHDVGKSGATAVRANAQAAGHSIVCGHTHRLEQIYFGTVLGERHVSASCGWLGDEDEADYIDPIRKTPWQHGFGVAHFAPSGDFRLELIPIVNGKVL